MNTSLPSIPGRPDFTLEQQLQGRYSGFIRERHRTKRRTVITHPIDNVESDVPSDRDDGILVETVKQNEGYRVYITIADVAAHVRANTPLGRAARERAFTVYGPGQNDPMFPAELEHRMSLEHQQERLGMLITIDLDKRFQPTHSEFEPVISHAETVSYAQAQQRMENHPQFQLMDQIAQGIQQHYFSPNGMVWKDLELDRRVRKSQLPGQSRAMEMVATYMLLANSSIANFFVRSGLPFLYRNFNENSDNPRAYYSTVPERHTALERSGLRGAYCHITSPIRRAADFINGASMHYVYNLLHEAELQLHKSYPSADKMVLHRELWRQAPEMMQAIQDAQAENPTLLHEAAHVSGPFLPKWHLESFIASAVHAALPHGAQPRESSIHRVCEWLLSQPCPYRQTDFEQYAQHINALGQSPEAKRIARLSEQFETGLNRLDELVSVPTHMEAMDDSKFSATLYAAARTGELPENLYRETLARIQDERFDPIQDGFAILIVAEPDTPEWFELKRQVCLAIKYNPGTINTLMERMASYVAPAELAEHKASLPMQATYDLEKPYNMHAALIGLQEQPGKQPVAPAFYSIGHNERAAISHARFSFLEHYAFGQLQPINQANIPNVLYAELDTERPKREVVESIVQQAGAQLQLKATSIENGFQVTAQASGGPFDSPIEVSGEAISEEAATNLALRRLLREPNFKYAVADTADNLGFLLNPQQILQELVDEQGGTLEFPRPINIGNGKPRFKAEVRLNFGAGRVSSYSGIGPNMDRAVRAACVEALDSYGWQLPDLTAHHAQSWVTDLAQENEASGLGK